MDNSGHTSRGDLACVWRSGNVFCFWEIGSSSHQGTWTWGRIIHRRDDTTFAGADFCSGNSWIYLERGECLVYVAGWTLSSVLHVY